MKRPRISKYFRQTIKERIAERVRIRDEMQKQIKGLRATLRRGTLLPLES